ncbi:MAG: choice-of-anchor J domain-containing protein [Bacteroidales bacterium]|jgi:hypothetical protein|nr:choice-of-anchor J domain-containing protein [Bacteroidales bacterium]
MKNIKNNAKRFFVSLGMTVFVPCSLLLVLTTSCSKDWNHRNFGDIYGKPQSETPNKDMFLTIADEDIAAIVKMLKDEAKTLPTADSSLLVKTADSINMAKQVYDIYAARPVLAKYLAQKYALKSGIVNTVIGSEIIVEYRVMLDEAAPALNPYELTDADYEAMGAPGTYHNFDKDMNKTFYLLAFLAQKFPYAQVGDIQALTYKFHFSSGLGDAVFSEVFVKTAAGWDVQRRQDKFILQADRSWKYVKNTMIHAISFLTGTFGVWTTVNVDGGAKEWYLSSIYGAVASGYNSGVNEDDWLISPKFNFIDREVARINYQAAHNYWVTNNECELYVSTTYNTGDEINENDWTKMEEYDYQLSKDWTFHDYSISLTPFVGNANVHIAFRYRTWVSTGGAAQMEVKNVVIEEKEVGQTDEAAE